MNARPYDGCYRDHRLDRVAYPLGGIGAGMICLEGGGALTSVSLRHRPEVYNQPTIFAALCIKGDVNVARVLQGPVAGWKVMFPWSRDLGLNSGNGGHGLIYGLPRFAEARFRARFPFASCELRDEALPVSAELQGWSPFLPGEADDSSLPVAALEYSLTNTSEKRLEVVFSFHAENIMRFRNWPGVPVEQRPAQRIRPIAGGFVAEQDACEPMPWAAGSLAVTTDAPSAAVNCHWFRGGWFDPITMVWRSVANGDVITAAAPEDAPASPGGSLYVPLALEPGEKRTVRVRLSWYVPHSDVRTGAGLNDPPSAPAGDACCAGRACPPPPERYRPWYASRFDGIDAVTAYWAEHYDRLREGTRQFTDCFYDTDFPAEVIDAVASNLTILKSPTVLRQHDGRLWGWEGCCDDRGCCPGSCTHVWNYAQALPHLFPSLERTLREAEFGENQSEAGHQTFRTPLPIRQPAPKFHAAADGQLGGIMKAYREWRISGDSRWLAGLWPRIRQSLDYCIETWDPDREGVLREPHHNTYDIEFWGPDGMCGSFYAGALRAATLMGRALGDETSNYDVLYEKAKSFLETELFDGEFFIQKIEWKGLRAPDPVEASRNSMGGAYSSDAQALAEREGPKYQYGSGCLSDGVLGDWIARACGVPAPLDPQKVESHLAAVASYNFRADLTDHHNPQRATFALGDEAGLLLCSWPKGGEPALPFVYSNEVWTGIEYQVASHLLMMGRVDDALKIVRAVRDRYDGRIRNPFNEYECGHWYARAMASYGLLQGMTGQWYDAVDQVLYLRPAIEGDFRAFLATATGYGTVGLRGGEPFVEVRSGTIPVRRVALGSTGC